MLSYIPGGVLDHSPVPTQLSFSSWLAPLAFIGAQSSVLAGADVGVFFISEVVINS